MKKGALLMVRSAHPKLAGKEARPFVALIPFSVFGENIKDYQ
jgi:hypothetical protein